MTGTPELKLTGIYTFLFCKAVADTWEKAYAEGLTPPTICESLSDLLLAVGFVGARDEPLPSESGTPVLRRMTPLALS